MSEMFSLIVHEPAYETKLTRKEARSLALCLSAPEAVVSTWLNTQRVVFISVL